MNSKIILAKNIKMDKKYVNVLSYTESDMISLLRNTNHLVAEANDYSFIRSQNSVRTGFSYELCLQANYIAFQNPDYSNKWFFGWIDEVVYKGENNTEIQFTIDSWSTWYDKWNKKSCFINRQHTLDDTIGLNTVEENLNIGEIIEESEEDLTINNVYYVALQCSWKPENSSGGTQYDGITVVNGAVYGTPIYLFKIENLSGFDNIQRFIYRLQLDRHINDLQNMFIVSDLFISQSDLTEEHCSIGGIDITFYSLSRSTISKVTFKNILKNYSFSDYNPKNNKCFCYPFNYLFITNNNGSNNIYKWEMFGVGENANFRVDSVLSIGGSCNLTPMFYKNKNLDIDESLSLGKLPTCGWSSDAFVNWLTQNSVNIVTNIASTGVSIATGNPSAVAGVSNASNIAGMIGSFYNATLLPNINGGQGVGDAIWGMRKTTFTFRKMRVKTEYLKIIDDYFTRFGYSVKKLEIPNLTGRLNWNYVEIAPSEEIGYGSVPSKYMEEINNAFRKGVTIWHNHSNLGDFSLNNPIV